MTDKTALLLRRAAEHCERRMYAVDQAMNSARAISGVAQEHRHKLGIASEVIRQEAVRLDEGDTDVIIGPIIFDQPSIGGTPFVLGNMTTPNDSDQ